MMKAWKKLTGIALTMCIMFTMLLVPDMEPVAKTKVSSQNVSVVIAEQAGFKPIIVTYSKEECKIKNLRSNSSDLLVKQISQQWYDSSSDNCAGIGIYAKKVGNYKVTFNICNDKNKVIRKHTINVTATTTANAPIKKATFAGKSTYFYSLVSKKSGRFKVTMNKGYKLKSITMRTCDAQGKEKIKKIKNNANVTLGEYAYKSEYSNEDSFNNSWSYHYNTDDFATTYFEVKCQNTKTKETVIMIYSIYKLPKN